MSIGQETKTVSKLSNKENRKNIRAICNDSLLRDIIKSYPIKELGFKQSFFLIFIKWKAVELLYLLAEGGVL